MPLSSRNLTRFVADGLRVHADPTRAQEMARYMKTQMPFYGVPKPLRVEVLREAFSRFPIESPGDYERAVIALWRRPHREEKYAALFFARRAKRFIALDRLPLYERLIREGAWWDFVDEIAANLVGAVWKDHRRTVTTRMKEWIDDDDLWIRRTALLGQLKHRDGTDARLLFRFCRARASEKEFFIRKAIGWALRQYSYVDPDAVQRFVSDNQAVLSGLSQREALKAIRRKAQPRTRK